MAIDDDMMLELPSAILGKESVQTAVTHQHSLLPNICQSFRVATGINHLKTPVQFLTFKTEKHKY